jgi:hypothetical protein
MGFDDGREVIVDVVCDMRTKINELAGELRRPNDVGAVDVDVGVTGGQT